MALVLLLAACGGGGGGEAVGGGTTPPPSGGASSPPSDVTHLVSIKLVSAQADALAPGTTMSYTAWGTFSDRVDRVISSTVSWSSSDKSVATVGYDGGQYGTVQALKAGPVRISATQDGVSVTADVTVMPIKLLEAAAQDVNFPGTDAISIDDLGRVQASVAHSFSGSMFGTLPSLKLWGYDATSGWSVGTAANVDQNNRPTNPVMAANPQGRVVRAWVGDLGVFAALYDPASGWLPARNVSQGAAGSSLRVSIEDGGNAMLLWVDTANSVSYVRYDMASDAWSAPQIVDGGDGGVSGDGVAFAATGAGDAVMVRNRWDLGPWTVHAARYSPATGWEAPQVLRSGSAYTSPDVAIGAAGYIVVVGADQFNNDAYAIRYVPGAGWTAPVTLASTPAAIGAKVVVNGAGQAVMVWGSNNDGKVWASRLSAGTWEATPTLMSSGGSGTPEVLRPFMWADGRIFASWNLGLTRVGARRFDPVAGWSAEEALRMGFKGAVVDVAFAFNSGGAGAVVWAEGFDRYDSDGISHRFYDFYVDNTIQY